MAKSKSVTPSKLRRLKLATVFVSSLLAAGSPETPRSYKALNT